MSARPKTKAREVGYTYDRLHRVTRADYAVPDVTSTLFAYDLLGNRNTVYDANLANEYNKVTTGTTLPGSDNYHYDVRGNP